LPAQAKHTIVFEYLNVTGCEPGRPDQGMCSRCPD
jgi:hypothetical protein